MKKSLVCSCIAMCLISLLGFINNQEIVGTWKPAKIVTATDASGEQYFESGAVYVKWEMKAGSASSGKAQTLTAIIPGVGSHILQQVLKDITFHADGNILATYSDAGYSLKTSTTPVWKKSEKETFTYKIVDNQLRVFPSMEKLMALLPTTGNNVSIDISGPLEIVKNGIPVNYRINDKTAVLYFDKSFIKQISPLIIALISNMKNTDFDNMGEMIKYMAADIPTLLEETTVLEIGLNLQK